MLLWSHGARRGDVNIVAELKARMHVGARPFLLFFGWIFSMVEADCDSGSVPASAKASLFPAPLALYFREAGAD